MDGGRGKRPVKAKYSDLLDSEAELPKAACAFYELGKCRKTYEGAVCRFKHSSLSDASKIPCLIKDRTPGVCGNGSTCLYRHEGPNGKGANLLPPLDFRLRGGGPRPLQACSTLGWNVNGGITKVRQVLMQARKLLFDVVTLQEVHKIDPNELETCAAAAGYRSFVSPATTLDSRAGVATFLRYEATCFEALHASATPLIEGRLLEVCVDINSMSTSLYNMYVPSDPSQRLDFLIKVRDEITFLPNRIIQCDANVVANVQLDVRQSPNTKTEYANKHAKLFESIMAGLGLVDIFRELDPEGPGFTRYRDATHTRIDRLFADNSSHKWQSLEVQSHLNRGLSDHSPLVGMIATVNIPAPNAREARIDPKVFDWRGTSIDITRIWRGAYRKYPPSDYGEAAPFEEACASCALYLQQISKPKREGTPMGAKREELLELDTQRAFGTPNPGWQVERNKIVSDLRTMGRSAHLSARTAHARTAAAEKMSKTYFNPYKKPMSQSDIPILYITPDWDHPDIKDGTTTDPDIIAKEFAKYYRWLFQSKASLDPEIFLKALSDRGIPEAIAEKLEKDVSLKEVSANISSLAGAKAPGPDKLPAEFWKEFEWLVVGDLHRVILEAVKGGALPDIMSEGTIAVLYKKGDPKEIRNYRPITLLNTSYKVYAKILVERMKIALQSVVSTQQLGFVPGRIINEASHLVKLLQAYLDENDEEGLFIAIDWEKAYDRASWEYKSKAYEALGFMANFRGMVELLCNPYHPPARTVKVGMTRSDIFHIFSGVPQGCPFSPLDFLIVLEALSRVLQNAKDFGFGPLHGIVVGAFEHLISQFADDTLALLRSYAALRAFWRVVHAFEQASGMRANMPKTIGIRGGSLRGKPPPIIPELSTHHIRWLADAPVKWVKLLGIPFWEGDETDDFWETFYLSVKRVISRWRRHLGVTTFGRVMLANAMLYSRIRYILSVMVPPAWFTMAIDEDVQALVWGKTFIPSKDEIGSETDYSRYMIREATTLKVREGFGLGLIDWNNHEKGLRARLILRYLDPTKGPWKDVLDAWFTRDPCHGRGATMSTLHIKELIKSTTGRAPKLPKFYKRAVAEIRTLGLEPTANALTRDGARNIPLWDSPSFPSPGGKMAEAWISIGLTKVASTVTPTGGDYSEQEIFDEIEAQCTQGGTLKVRRGRTDLYRVSKGEHSTTNMTYTPPLWIPWDSIWKDWKRIMGEIPPRVREVARAEPHFQYEYGNALRMMYAMAPQWKGKRLGIREQGRMFPVSCKEKAPTRASNLIVFLGDSDYTYGKPSTDGPIIEVHTSVLGQISGEGGPLLLDLEEGYPPGRWGAGLLGPAESSFPSPKEWHFRHSRLDLDKVNVKHLTRLFSLQTQKPPSCLAKWEAYYSPMKWGPLSKAYSNAFLTGRDYHPHFSHILHRRFYSRVKAREADTRCRMCGGATESVEHLGRCRKLFPLREWLKDISGEYSWDERGKPAAFLLGLHPHETHGAGSTSLWLLVWSALITNLVKMSTEGAILNTEVVIKKALIIFMERALSLLYQAKANHRRAMSREGGEPPESYPKLTRLIAPLGEIIPSDQPDMSPKIAWSDPFLHAMKEAGLDHLLLTKKVPKGTGPSSPECFSNQHTSPERANQTPPVPNGNTGRRRSVAFRTSRIQAETVSPP